VKVTNIFLYADIKNANVLLPFFLFHRVVFRERYKFVILVYFIWK